jgi:predicted membrane protein
MVDKKYLRTAMKFVVAAEAAVVLWQISRGDSAQSIGIAVGLLVIFIICLYLLYKR